MMFDPTLTDTTLSTLRRISGYKNNTALKANTQTDIVFLTDLLNQLHFIIFFSRKIRV